MTHDSDRRATRRTCPLHRRRRARCSPARPSPPCRRLLRLGAARLDQSSARRARSTIEEFDAAGKSLGTETVAKVVKTEEEWQAQLSPLAFEVTRQEGTEQAFTGPWLDEHDARASSAASAATPPSSRRTPSSTPAPAGRASGSRSRKENVARDQDGATAWCGPPIPAPAATPISATSSTTARSRPGSATA